MNNMPDHVVSVAVEGGGSCRDVRQVSLANVRPIPLKDSRTPDETLSCAEIHGLTLLPSRVPTLHSTNV
jgi:hypothetical protein